MSVVRGIYGEGVQSLTLSEAAPSNTGHQYVGFAPIRGFCTKMWVLHQAPPARSMARGDLALSLLSCQRFIAWNCEQLVGYWCGWCQ